jgi:hypothetical protein
MASTAKVGISLACATRGSTCAPSTAATIQADMERAATARGNGPRLRIGVMAFSRRFLARFLGSDFSDCARSQ